MAYEGSPFKQIQIDNHMNVVADGGTLIQWELKSDFLQPGPYTFFIQSAMSATSDDTEWTSVTRVVDTCWAKDYTNYIRGKELSLFYRVVLVDGDRNIFYSDPQRTGSQWSKRDWRLAREIIRKENLVLEKYTGIPGYLLKRKWFGTACPECTDTYGTGEPMDSTCTTCYGTGIAGGYYDPFDYTLSLEPEKRLTKINDQNGELMTVVTKLGRGLAYPHIQYLDVWVDSQTDQRFYIHNIANVARLRNIQLVVTMELRLASADDVIYKIPILEDRCA